MTHQNNNKKIFLRREQGPLGGSSSTLSCFEPVRVTPD